MTIIGKKNDKVKPSGFIEGPGGKIDISGLNCIYAVGAIPVCRVFIPPEFLSQIPDEQTNEIYTVKVSGEDGDKTIFTGYIAGDSGRITGTKVMGGVDIVHVARDMDETRISSPSLHPSSISDYSYTMMKPGSNLGSSSTFEPATFFKPGGGKLPEQIVSGLKEIMSALQSETMTVGGEKAKTETLQKGIDLLSKLTFKDGTLKGDIESPLASSDGSNNSINTWVRQRCEGSFNGARSVWDTLTAIFSEFGIYMICDNEGKVFTAVDCSSMSSDKNKLDGEYIATFDKTSAMFRSISEVLLASENVRATKLSDKGAPGGFVSAMSGSAGATLVLQVPGWLNPIVETDSEKLVSAMQAYAKAMLFLEKSKFRTVSITGPLAPLAVPGTIIQISPYSAMKARSGGQIEDFKKTYIGYCYQLVHEIDVQGEVLQTTFYLKNVSIAGGNNELSEHPLFSDVKPFELK